MKTNLNGIDYGNWSVTNGVWMIGEFGWINCLLFVDLLITEFRLKTFNLIQIN